MFMSPKTLKKWEATRAKGKTRFIIKGITLGLMGPLLIYLFFVLFVPGSLEIVKDRVIGFIFSLPVAILPLVLLLRSWWNSNEKLYFKTKQRNSHVSTTEGPLVEKNLALNEVSGNAEASDSMDATPEECRWASTAHGSMGIFIVPFLIPAGLMVSSLIYSIYKDKSKFVAFHALQTLCLQLIITTLWGLVYVIMTFMPAKQLRSGNPQLSLLLAAAGMLIGISLLVFLFGGMFASLIAFNRTRCGDDFSYWVVGKWARTKVYGNSQANSRAD